MLRKLLFFIIFTLILFSCKVTFISGYDAVIDETLIKIQRDFNLHWIKLSRNLKDNDPNNQAFENYQDYYDNLETDLIVLNTRVTFLPPKSDLIKSEIVNLDSAFSTFIALHKQGLSDNLIDDRHDIRDNINGTIISITKLEEVLKRSGKLE